MHGSIELVRWLAIIYHDDSSGRQHRPDLPESRNCRLVQINVEQTEADRPPELVLLYVGPDAKSPAAGILLECVLEPLEAIIAEAGEVAAILPSFLDLEGNVCRSKATERVNTVVILSDSGGLQMPVKKTGGMPGRATQLEDVAADIARFIDALHEECELFGREVIRIPET